MLYLAAFGRGKTATDCADPPTLAAESQSPEPAVSIMALHGLGKELWQGVDTPAYVARLRRNGSRAMSGINGALLLVIKRISLAKCFRCLF